MITLPVVAQIVPPAKPTVPEPAKPAVVAPPTPEDELRHWFLSAPRRGAGVPVRVCNDVVPYIDYDRYYAAAAEALEAAAEGTVVLLSGWALQLDTPVTLAGHLEKIGELLARVGDRGGQVRVLLSGHLANPNEPAVSWLNGKKGCAAIQDDRLRLAGSFHQKALVVAGSELVAFVGGMDFGAGRLADPVKHIGPWHDVQLRITGPAAADLYQTLADRWESWPQNKSRPLRRVAAGGGAGRTKRAVQVVRTYGNPRTGTALPALRSSNTVLSISRTFSQLGSNEFSFAPTGESGIHDLLVQAIRATTSTIYVEDQYFIASARIGGDEVLLRALAETMAKPTFKHLLVLTCGVGTIQGELFQVNQRRRALWRRLAASHPDRISIWAYKGPERCSWIHSKMWIFDDTFAMVGSANFNRRGLTHDGELGVGVIDMDGRDRGMVRELRKSLWLKHLPTERKPVRADQVDDFETGRALWVDTPDTLISRLDLEAGNPYGPDRLVLCDDPKKTFGLGQIAQNIACDYAPRLRIPTKSYDAQWDHLLDPDGS